MSISLHPDTPRGRTLAGSPVASAGLGAVSSGARNRSGLFIKYVALFVAVVGVALLANGSFEVFFYYREHKASLIRIQHEQAVAAAAEISRFIKEIESQLGWTTQLPWSAGSIEQHRFDALRLLRQVPAITELAQVDSAGKGRLRVSRLAMDVIDSGLDLSKEPKFTEAVAHKVYYGPVYFHRESEPYMTLAVAGTRKDAGVSIAEVNLKLIWDVVSQIKVGEHGRAYVVAAQGRLIAHPDISLVLRNTDMSKLAQVQAARVGQAGGTADELQVARNIQGQEVLTASAPILPLGWTMFVELPVEEAYAPLSTALQRLAFVLLAASVFAVLAGILLARRMVGPIQALRAGAARFGAGDLGQRISIKTGDELESLADQFNEMGARLQESYADLEKKVELRTTELSESLQQQTAISEVLRVISSTPGDLDPVFQKMLENATRICDANFGTMNLYEDGAFRPVAHYNVPPAYAANVPPAYAVSQEHMPFRAHPQSGLGTVARSHQVVHIEDVRNLPPYLEGDPSVVAIADLAGARTYFVVPMLRENELIGAITIFRQEVKPFTVKQTELVANFANQAVIAIENARLLDELQARTEELGRSVQELKALSDVTQAVNSTLDLETVLATIVAKAVQLSGTDAGAIYVFDEAQQQFRLSATYGMDEALIAGIREQRIGAGERLMQAVSVRGPLQVPDLRQEPSSPALELILRAGYRSLLVVPLLSRDTTVGALVVRRCDTGTFAAGKIDLLQTFAAQSVLAIQNARLFHEIEDKSQQLEIASKHKSQFLANMSHELRTPLNAILGYTELILDNIYGDMPDKMRAVLERVQSNGKHLLGLINDVLDLSKIEAGQLTLSLTDYSLRDIVHAVVVAVESLATEKDLALNVEVAPDLPIGRGDERRLTQVLLNLVGNAIKFTDRGSVSIKASAADGTFTVAVRDTGPGISADHQVKIFEEFAQADTSSTRKKGGTGLGLSISKRIIELHHGRVWVESVLGEGATFSFTVPVRVERQARPP
jgi:signal transduction histidine kinase